jgi:hypothetical protein
LIEAQKTRARRLRAPGATLNELARSYSGGISPFAARSAPHDPHLASLRAKQRRDRLCISERQPTPSRRFKRAPAVFPFTDPCSDLTNPLPDFPECRLYDIDEAGTTRNQHKM